MQLVRDGCRAVHSVVFKVHGRLPGLPIPATDPDPPVAASTIHGQETEWSRHPAPQLMSGT